MGPSEEKTREYEIEKMSDLKAAANGELSFDNDGNIIVNNRQYRRNLKRLWRAVTEGKRSIRWYTHKHRTNGKASRKRERQNRRKGRLGLYA